MKTATDLTPYAALIGLDWADQKHDLARRVPGTAALERSTLEHTPEAIATWVARLRQRGKQKWVHRRWARPVFVHQTFVEHADQSIRQSAWAKRCYDQLKTKGLGHWEAVRVLAIKWQRILWRCWQDRTPYNEAVYVQSLQRRGLKAYADLVV